jgi:hypothetical protein
VYLPILPETERLDLSEAGYPGLVAVYRPMDVLDKSRWYDTCGGKVGTWEASVIAVRQQLRTLEENGKAVEAQLADGSLVPFDATNAQHFGAVPFVIVSTVFNALMARTALTEDERKN